MKDSRKRGLVGALAVLLALVCVGGTIAWMTAEDSLKNSFTVGSFNEPTRPSEPDNPDTDEEDEDKDEDIDGEKPDGFLFETEWNESETHQLTPGKATAKNPNIGLGKDSQDAYIFIFVKNNSVETADGVTLAGNAPFFSIEKQWAAVTDDNFGAGGNASQDVTPTQSTGAGAPDSGAYVDGLFMYVGDGATGFETKPVKFVVDENIADNELATNENAYTGELFETITIPDGNGEGIKATGANVSVYAYIYGADDADDEGTAKAALDAAVQWAEGIKADSSK